MSNNQDFINGSYTILLILPPFFLSFHDVFFMSTSILRQLLWLLPDSLQGVEADERPLESGSLHCFFSPLWAHLDFPLIVQSALKRLLN